MPESVEISDAAATFAPLMETDIRVSGRLVEANVDHPTAVVHRLTGWAIDAGVELDSLSVGRASLEEVYLSLTDSAIDSLADVEEPTA